MMVSLIEHGRKNINDDHGIKSDSLFICQQCNETINSVSIALPEGTAIVHATMTHMATEETPRLAEILQAHDSCRECQAGIQAVAFRAPLFTYDRDGFLVQQAPIDGALLKYVPVPLGARTLYISYYPNFAVHPGERFVYDTMSHHSF